MVKQPIRQRLKTAVEANLVAVPAADFLMGNDVGRADERPAHRVQLAALRSALRPVTNAEYDAFVVATGATPPPFRGQEQFTHPDQPVVGVSWYEAVAYCDWLAAETGLRVRLPTEAEREWASLGGRADLDWPWPGSAHPQADAISSARAPHVPLEACANGYGPRCMAENVHEWCSDWYGKDYYAGSPVENPTGPTTGARKASRGGAWRHSVKFTRLTARSAIPPEFRYNDYGFRIYSEM